MVLWQGLTESGTAVPVQVTEAGKVVAEGRQGPQGPQGSEGPQGPPGKYSEGDDVVLGSGTFVGDVGIGGLSSAPNIQLKGGDGSITAAGGKSIITSGGTLLLDSGGNAGSAAKVTINSNGSGTFGQRDTSATDKSGIDINATGSLYIQGKGSTNDTATVLQYSRGTDPATFKVQADGRSTFAENKCGFTADGELYFTSRGTRYKLVVQGALCNAEPYTREMELRERVADKQKPRSTDSVPED